MVNPPTTPSNTQTTYANVAARNRAPNKPQNGNHQSTELPTVLGQMFLDFLSLNPTTQQKVDFLNKTEKLVSIFNGKN